MRSQRGFAAVLVVLLLPVCLALLGVAIDGAMLVHLQLNLETATTAAALAATDAYDRDLWQAQHQVSINPTGATALAAQYLGRNRPRASVDTVSVDPPNRVTVTTSYRAPVFFMRLFGATGQTLHALAAASKG